MAEIKAIKNGNWNDPTVWSTGVVPGLSDDAYTNNFVIQLNVTPISTLSLRGTANVNIGAVAGGYFNVNVPNLVITSNFYASSLYCLYCNYSNTTITITGNSYGGAGASGAGFRVDSNALVYYTGNLTGGAAGPGCYIGGAPTINLVGNVYGGVSSNGIIQVGGIINHTGDVIAAADTTWAAVSVTTTGATYNLTGYGRASNFGAAIYNYTTTPGNVNITGGGITSVNGVYPFLGKHKYNTVVSPTAQIVTTLNNTVVLQDIANIPNILPPQNKVTKNYIYNAGQLIGTRAEPDPASVALGVAVGETFGTALLTGDSFLDSLENSTHPMAVRLRNCSTVQSTGAQIAAANI